MGAAQRGQMEKAIAALHEAINIDPEHALAYKNLGLALYTKEDFDAATMRTTRRSAMKPVMSK
jgi:Flp pilus assembly protein TadD